MQVAAGLELGIGDGEDGDLGQGVLEERLEVRGLVALLAGRLLACNNTTMPQYYVQSCRMYRLLPTLAN